MSIYSKRVKAYFQNRVFIPLSNFLLQGITPEKLSLTVALGLLLGICPVIGTTTIMCTILAFVLRLNLPAIYFVNYIVLPVQIVLFVPFIKLGEFLFGFDTTTLTAEQLLDILHHDFFGALQSLWYVFLDGILAWLVIFIPAMVVIYYLTLPAFRRFVSNNEKKIAISA